MIKAAFTLALFCAGAPAWAGCHWTYEPAVPRDIRKDPLFSEKPIVQSEGCKTGEPPICAGYAVCTQEISQPDRITTLACVSVLNGTTYECPSADVCSADPKITIGVLTKVPVESAAPPPADPATPAPPAAPAPAPAPRTTR